ncbi:MAG: radical SAM family heme chaperone HemW [Ginsengibacter sp.]
MSGIYFHIPFCKQACHYCNFHFSTSLMYKDEMIAAMQKEIILTKNILTNNKTSKIIHEREEASEAISTIYFGGGTPSLLSIDEIKKLLETTKEVYNIATDTEITLEANPDDINENKLSQWNEAGVNRLSIGIQSFNQQDLQWMNRAHNEEQALQCISMVKKAGFASYSLDLIYGTPTLEDDEWKNNVETVIALKVPHVSCYALTVEPATALQKMITQKKKKDVDHEAQARQFSMLMNWMNTAGYEHYEISNFALPGYRSRHNSSYWQGKSYIGIGPSAHSYLGNIRRWNVRNNALYIKSLENNILPFEKEELTLTQQLNEYIMTSLRTIEGLDLDFVKENFGEERTNKLLEESAKFQKTKKLKDINQNLILTQEGKLFADGIAADLFFSPL